MATFSWPSSTPTRSSAPAWPCSSARTSDVVTYSEVAALAEYQPPGRPLVVVFGPGLADGQGLAEIERFTRARPDAGAILVAAELSTSLLQQALRSGVRDVLGAPTEADVAASSRWNGCRAR